MGVDRVASYDEDVSILVAVLLRGRGLDAVTAVAERMLGQD
jgi:hypothetical protein